MLADLVIVGGMAVSKTEFAGKLRAVREAAGLSQGALAKALDKDIRTVNRWEAPDDPVIPHGRNLRELAGFFDVDLSYFGLGGTTDRLKHIEDQLTAQRQLALDNRALLLEIRALLIATGATPVPAPPAEIAQSPRDHRPTGRAPRHKKTRQAS